MGNGAIFQIHAYAGDYTIFEMPFVIYSYAPSQVVILAEPGTDEMFCNGASDTKELTKQTSIEACFAHAQEDVQCKMEYGVAYALQSNDLSDTTRAERCLCIAADPCSNWHATDL